MTGQRAPIAADKAELLQSPRGFFVKRKVKESQAAKEAKAAEREAKKKADEERERTIKAAQDAMKAATAAFKAAKAKPKKR